MKVLDRRLSRMPQPWRTIVDWVVTIALAVGFVLAFQAEVAKPYRIPSSSMEPTLHCAKPGSYCEGRFDDRVIANRLAYRFGDPKRGQIVVFTAPSAADRCGGKPGGSAFVKRIVGLPGELISERDGGIYINGKRLVEPYVHPSRRGRREQELAPRRGRPLLPPGRQPDSLLRLPHLGNGAPQQPHRPGHPHVLATQPAHGSLAALSVGEHAGRVKQEQWATCLPSRSSTASTFRTFRGASDYPHLARIITANAKGEGDDRVETAEGIASGYDHLDRCDPARDLLVAEADGAPVAYCRVWWDQEPDGPRVYRQVCFSDPAAGGRGIGAALFEWSGERLREIAGEHDAPEKVHEAWSKDTNVRRDLAHPRCRLRADHLRRPDGAADGRRPP